LVRTVSSRIRRLGAAFAAAAAFMTGPAAAQTAPAAANCAPNANLAEVEKKLPAVFRDLQIMNQLPQTGQGLYEQLKNRAWGLQTCLAAADSDGRFQGRTATIPANSGTNVALHEYFHGLQSYNGSLGDNYRLTMKDSAVAHLLMEAAAAAYELVAEQEAKNRDIAFYRPSGVGYHSHSPKMRAAFQKAHDAAFAGNAWRDAPTRTALALQAGGRAAVRSLLEGSEPSWTKHYRQRAVFYTNDNISHLTRNADAGYENFRRGVFNRMGAVAWNINIIPEELTGPSADGYINTYFSKAQMRVLDEQPPKLGLWSMP
jgi:hypothetical protein